MRSWSIEKLMPLLKECGEIALNYYDNPPLELKADKSVVTAADKAIENRLALEFDHPEKEVYLIGEETVKSRSEDYISKAMSGIAWIVDPIDGTAPYSAHFPAWGISVALMVDGVIKEGAIYLPPQNDCIITNGDKVLRCSDVRGSGQLEEFKFKYQSLSAAGIISASQKSTKNNIFKMSNQVFSWSGCVASFYNIFNGKILAYVADLKLWDIAACLAIIKHSKNVIHTPNNNKLSVKIDNTFFDLEPTSSRRWQLRDFAIIAPDENTVNFILENSNLEEY
jgi:fructose-1,6-bisphosphatase/inositol monophosphatase family enzyme